MDENHQNKTASKQMANEDKSQLPSFSSEDEKEAQKELARLREKENKIFKGNHKRTGFEDKTLWDYLNLFGTLAIPLVVALATIGLGLLQIHLADLQHQSDQLRALDQQQATILQTYLDNIQDLLLHNNLHASKRQDENDVRMVARIRTITTLERLDPERKGVVIQFLFEADLIGINNPKITINKADNPIIALNQANLRSIDLSGLFLSGADMHDTYLNGANLKGTILSFCNLSISLLNGANLHNAKLENADLHNSDLSGADLSGADLRKANLSGAHNMTQQQLDQVYSCKGATLPKGIRCNHNGP